MSKIQLSQRMYSVRDIKRLLDNGELSIQPKYQRRRTDWPTTAKTALLDTILNNFPIPPIYLRDYIDENGKRKKEIIDGQQRISTIFEYYTDEYALAKNIFDEEFYGLKYSDLPYEEQILIEDFEVSFISIRGASDADIISIFSRLNSYSAPLNPQEKLNSLYTGELKTLIYELASEYNTFWTDFKIISSSSIARMNDAKLVSQIMNAILNGITTEKSPNLEKMYKEHEESFCHKSEISSRFNNTMSILGVLLEEKNIQKAFTSLAMFYSLFLAVYDRMYGISNSPLSLNGHSAIDIHKTIESLDQFAIQYSNNGFSAEFMLMMKQATGNAGQRTFRHIEISKRLI
ncbi:DUF262 domain-containing protein [Vibrio cyclitrophicus]